jgi:hypothetical protein
MAQPVIVAGATAAGGAAVGPGEHHEVRPYSRKAGAVKIVRSKLLQRARAFLRFEPRQSSARPKARGLTQASIFRVHTST